MRGGKRNRNNRDNPKNISNDTSTDKPQEEITEEVGIKTETGDGTKNQELRAEKKRRILIIILVILDALILIGVSVGIFFLIRGADKSETSRNDWNNLRKIESNKIDDSDDENTETIKYANQYTGKVESWDYREVALDSRIKVPDVYRNTKYYKVANLTGGDEFFRLNFDSDRCSSRVSYFVSSKDKLIVASNLGDCHVDESFGLESATATIDGLMPAQGDLTYQGQTWAPVYTDSLGARNALDQYATAGYTSRRLTKIGDAELYEIAAPKDGFQAKSRFYDAIMPDGSAYRYVLKSADVSNDDGTLNATFTDGGNANVTFVNPMRGCGSDMRESVTILTFTPNQSDLQEVGALADGSGRPLYKITSDNFQRMMYDEYIVGHNNATSFATFKATLNSVVFQDGLGQWVLLQATNWGPSGECAKPVIYLYPTKATTIDVKVGANVRISEPFYPVATGWQNVIAKPNGQLTYNGKTYDSLFWEGKGVGLYPNLSGVGTVVTQENLIPTIEKQLADQGLNRKETTDFLEYWRGKLPHTPYVKLSWLTTAQMNQLAPLSVSPKPDTVIRVFLDARGLDRPISLTPQVFTSPARNGFTLVEWGGLKE